MGKAVAGQQLIAKPGPLNAATPVQSRTLVLVTRLC